MRSSSSAAAPFGLTADIGERQALVTARLDRPAERCYRLFCDVEQVPRWLGIVQQVTVHERDARGRPARADFVGVLQDGAVCYTLSYTYDDRARRVSWRQHSGGVEAMVGSAVFTPHDDGGCLLDYSLRAVLPDTLSPWSDPLYRSRPAEAVVIGFCEWVSQHGGRQTSKR